MSTDIKLDAADLYTFAAQLGDIADEIPKGAVAAMRGAAHTGKEAWQAGLEDSAVPASASTISYRFGGNGERLSATIENDQGSARLQGFAHAREFGSVTVAPAAPAAAAAAVAAADLERGLAVAGERAIQRAIGS